MDWGGVIAGALGGGATAVSQVADQAIQKQDKMDLLKMQSDMEEQKQMRLAEFQNRMVRDNKMWEQGDEYQGRVRANAVASEKELGAVRSQNTLDTYRGQQDINMQNLPRELAARSEAERKAAADLGNDKEALRGIRAKAQAQHFESAGSAAQAELARFELQSKKTIMGLRTQLADAQASGDKTAAEGIQSRLDALVGDSNKEAKFAAIAEKAGAAITQALKVQGDPMASDEQKSDAARVIADQRAIMHRFAQKAGVDLSATQFSTPPAGAIELLRKRPDTAAAFDEKYGPGASKKYGGAPAAAPVVTAPTPRPQGVINGNRATMGGSLNMGNPSYAPDNNLSTLRLRGLADNGVYD